MGKLIYSSIMSVDGFTVDAAGHFNWSAPDEVLHAFVNEVSRPLGTYLYGRRMYGVMSVWQTLDTADEPAVMADYQAIWRAADKIVYSSTLTEPSTPRTRIEPFFDADAVWALKQSTDADISIGGPGIAAHAIRAGLVDEYQLFVSPIAVGGGTPFFPSDARVPLTLLDHRRFEAGAVYLRYASAR
ncbi:dihydrofolate reductase family protein [Subtercola lobariae]|uniref:Deaminase n=1 Tax=Subtercola lobariae TaxID=1588641 RepID=A0A917B216_9MICO|nr:dihydrofolate reductase family protein [Subtercola lobariae]GGF18010.1 deaminase [Subtercola lobariae]